MQMKLKVFSGKEPEVAEKSSLEQLMARIKVDAKPQKTHKAMLLGLLCCWVGSGFAPTFQITRRKLMIRSGIKGIGTYHKHLSDLVNWDYIMYEPSYHPAKGSRVSILS